MTAAAGGALSPQGPVARAMADLWWLMLALGLAVFAVFALLLVAGLVRRPRQPADPTGRHLVGPWIVGAGVMLPLVVLTVVFAATVHAMRVVPSSPPPDALPVEIVGHQWWYEVSYPTEGVSTVNELHVPVGRPVALELRSADVIHSFWVPALGGKLDLLPDGATTLVLQADEPGEHRARCAEFCGLEHAHMELLVVAEPADRFASWVAAER